MKPHGEIEPPFFLFEYMYQYQNRVDAFVDVVEHVAALLFRRISLCYQPFSRQLCVSSFLVPADLLACLSNELRWVNTGVAVQLRFQLDRDRCCQNNVCLLCESTHISSSLLSLVSVVKSHTGLVLPPNTVELAK